HQHGASWGTPLDAQHLTLAERLAERGYATGGFVANLVFASSRSGLAQGFSTYEDIPTRPTLGHFLHSFRIVETATRALVHRMDGPDPALIKQTAEDINRDFLAWLDRTDRLPFFAFLNYMDVHSPFGLHSPFDTLFGDRPRYNRIGQEGWNDATGHYDEEQRLSLLAAYDASWAYLDHQIGRLFDQLEARGILDETVVVIVGDHGEAFGEHGLRFHSAVPYDEVLKVPAVIFAPGRIAPGSRATGLRQQTDLLPTVAEVMGARVEGGRLPGVSLLSEVPDSRTLYHAGWIENQSMAVRRGSRKFVYHFGRRPIEVFDTERDPLETSPEELESQSAAARDVAADLHLWRARVNAAYAP
ncbi:MAG: sulfatase-like hydrolase/transferase, partial [Rhodothermales bacterium]|nr:sulfatase-like hydrolase/transferase [Rhodothermales bacterium]